MITKLTAEQQSRFPEFVEKWIKIGLCTDRVDMSTAEFVSNFYYERILYRDRVPVILLSSPLAAWLGARLLSSNAQVRNQVRDQVRDKMWNQVEDQVSSQVWSQVSSQVRDQVWSQVRDQVSSQVWDQVWSQVRDQVSSQVWDQVSSQVWDQVEDQVEDQLSSQVRNQVWSQVRGQVRDQVEDQLSSQVSSQVRDQVSSQVWDQVSSQVWDQVEDQVWSQVRDQVSSQVWDQVRDKIWNQVRDKIWNQVRDKMWNQVEDQVSSQVWSQVEDQVSSQVRNQVRNQVRAQYVDFIWPYIDGQFSSSYLSFYDYIETVLNMKYKNGAQWDWYRKTSEIGLFYPLSNYCVISDRPHKLLRNNNGLHCESGMTLEYTDGWGIYSLNGILMKPEYVITPADKIDIKTVISEENVDQRRELIRKVGVDRFLSNGKILEENDNYKLVDMASVFLNIGYAPHLFMKNPSIDNTYHLEGVGKECESIQQAINWRAGNIEVTWSPAQLS